MPQKPPLEVLIEAALFFRGGTMSVKELGKALGASAEEVHMGVESLKTSLGGRGIRLVVERDEVGLATAPEAHEMIETMRREELEGPLGKAGLETLSVIAFRGPLARSDIEYVRGVNCSSILRSLMIRGLIERIDNPVDKRSFLYRATPELPAYFGVASLEEVPGYAEMRAGIERVFAERDDALAKTLPEEGSPQTEEHAA
jgi:segregation and condensation protein B